MLVVYLSQISTSSCCTESASEEQHSHDFVLCQVTFKNDLGHELSSGFWFLDRHFCLAITLVVGTLSTRRAWPSPLRTHQDWSQLNVVDHGMGRKRKRSDDDTNRRSSNKSSFFFSKCCLKHLLQPSLALCRSLGQYCTTTVFCSERENAVGARRGEEEEEERMALDLEPWWWLPSSSSTSESLRCVAAAAASIEQLACLQIEEENVNFRELGEAVMVLRSRSPSSLAVATVRKRAPC